MKKHIKKKKIEKAINTLVKSFLSHIPYTYLPHEDGKRFHKTTAKEYWDRVKELLDLL